MNWLKRVGVNVKTTAAGAVFLIATVGPYTGFINEKQAELIKDAAVVFGLTNAKDDKVTGGTKENSTHN